MIAYFTCVPGDPLRIRWTPDAYPLSTDDQATSHTRIYLWHPEFNISLHLKLWKRTAHNGTKPTSPSCNAGV
ncbi:hypothetical protein R3I94_014447 [Phoxinus phoxinus]|uniref:Uncharacterized protein n=1 Tax=Phoxinus phoxinus TaxID=58324 RepID=A0AAN9CS56_9TELE